MFIQLRKTIARKFFPVVFAVFLCPKDGTGAGGQATNLRFFFSPDGLAESWASFVTVGSSGRIWVSHGSVNRLSWFTGWPGPDGKFVYSMPSPGVDLKVYESDSGQLWSLYLNGIQQFRDGKWVRYKIDEITNLYPADKVVRTLIPFLPGEKNHCFYLMPEGLKLFNAGTQAAELILASNETRLGKFIDMIESRDGGIWITGNNGAAKLSFKPGTLAPLWREHLVEGLGVTELDKPSEGENGGLLAVARDIEDNEKKLLYYDQVKWRIISGYKGAVIRAWFGPENSCWVVKQKNTFSVIKNGREEVQEKTGILAGDFFDVAVEPNGIFWVSTSHGLARYAPSPWRTPAEIEDIKDRVHVIHEDREGRVWFGAVRNLLLFRNGRWKSYPMPEGLETQPYFTQSICSLPDGRIAIGTIPYNDFLLIFDPEKERFEKVPHVVEDTLPSPAWRVVGMISPLRDGRVLVQTLTAVDSSVYRLEVFDGRTFKPYFDIGKDWGIGNLRYIYEAGNGHLWLGGQSQRALAVYRDGEYTSFVNDEGYAGTGSFCINEVEDGKIWVGGRNEILEYDKGKWRVILSDLSSVRCITTLRDGSIWVASGTGLHRRFNGSWVTNTADDGLANTAVFQVLQDSRGRVWAGTISGLSLYNPEADTDPPETIISAKNNLKETPPAGEVRLHFSGMDKWKQTQAGRLLFSYRLDHGEWSPFRNSNVALFNNLPYGKHLFEVRAMDTNLNYDPEPANFDFTVLLPWYKETGFQVIAAAAAVLIFFLLGFAIYRHVILEKLVVERTTDLQQANLQLEDKISELERAEAHLKDSQKM
ncbi:MAG: triple tyrosine motif-containing protein, partial [Gemmatimonadota bacterium]|nr:triple tyrosine motif-containing protein [Gemmatimonadota bacterium]